VPRENPIKTPLLDGFYLYTPSLLPASAEAATGRAARTERKEGR
jgi:hypothetical protein